MLGVSVWLAAQPNVITANCVCVCLTHTACVVCGCAPQRCPFSNCGWRGGGAVKIKINGAGKFLSLVLDAEFLKEDPKLISDTLLVAIQDAAKQAKEFNDAEMQKVTSAFQMPGMF